MQFSKPSLFLSLTSIWSLATAAPKLRWPTPCGTINYVSNEHGVLPLLVYRDNFCHSVVPEHVYLAQWNFSQDCTCTFYADPDCNPQGTSEVRTGPGEGTFSGIRLAFKCH
ncbi:unnamed protein product [Periconia digitata]|uniref:Uncharacterized protein n=1 Tax=Periconia digitata TaxID=1303443 RepID=A0A9W4U3E7_9PLEO|nr:unnamed protein product [Periconia digitata]